MIHLIEARKRIDALILEFGENAILQFTPEFAQGVILKPSETLGELKEAQQAVVDVGIKGKSTPAAAIRFLAAQVDSSDRETLLVRADREKLRTQYNELVARFSRLLWELV